MNTPAYSAQQRREAAEWFVRIHDVEDPSPLLLQRWLQWLNADDANRRAFEAVEQAWHHVPQDLQTGSIEKASAADLQDDYDGSMSIADWQRSKTERSEAPSSRQPRKHAARWLALAASVLAAVGVSWYTLELGPFARPSSGEFHTETGEHMELVLADGSRVTLGAQTSLSIDFTEQSRDLRLNSGEAFFKVKKDPHRPFRVRALEGVITAVGTSFNVRTTGDRVTVAVVEGIVAVADADAPASPLAEDVGENGAETPRIHRLSQGEQVTFTSVHDEATFQTLAITRIDPEQSVRWRDGWLVYRQESLRDVLQDVARYSGVKLEVGANFDEALRFTGAVNTESVDEWIAALPEVFPIHIQPHDQSLRVTSTSGRHEPMRPL